MFLRKLAISLVIILTVGYLSVKPFTLYFARKELGNIFPGSKISVDKVRIGNKDIVFSGIEINSPNVFSIKLKEAGVKYSIAYLLKGMLDKAWLGEISLNVSAPQMDLAGLNDYFRLRMNKNPVFLPLKIEVSKLWLRLKTKDLSLVSSVSFQVDLKKQELDYCDIKIDSFSGYSVKMEDAFLRLEQTRQGGLSVKKLSYDKLKIENIKAQPEIYGVNLKISPLSALVYNGEIKSYINLNLAKTLNYTVRLECIGIDLEKIVDDLKVRERIDLSGQLNGRINFEGDGLNVRALDGNLFSLDPGGRFIIKDDRTANDIASRSGYSSDMIMNSFKNYHYDKAKVKIFLEKGNLFVNISMDANEGARNLVVVFHNFTKNEEAIE